MKNIIAIIPLATVIVTGAYAFAADDSVQSTTKTTANGGYVTTTDSTGTSDDGTYNSSKTKDKVSVDSSGNVTRKVKVKEVSDPKGLMNKKTYKGEAEYQDKNNGGYKESSSEKSTDAAGTNYSNSTKTNVDVDAKGNVTETSKSEDVVDPKGLMNKTKTITKTKTVNGDVVEDTKEVK